MEIHIMKKTTTTINIQNEANIKAEGKHVHHHSKPIICIETGEVFVSMTDAAERVGVHISTVSSCVTGKTHTVKGKHYCYLNRVNESLDAIVTRLRETSNDSEDAKKWREYQAEQERIRLEKEAHDAAIAKAQEKVNKRRAICERIQDELARALDRLTEAEVVLNELLNNN